MSVVQVALLWRNPGLSREEFVDLYENGHRPLGEAVFAGYATRYDRRYLAAMDGHDDGPDVITEIEYPDRATMDACLAALMQPGTIEPVLADEERLFDPARTRMFTVENTCASDLPPIA